MLQIHLQGEKSKNKSESFENSPCNRCLVFVTNAGVEMISTSMKTFVDDLAANCNCLTSDVTTFALSNPPAVDTPEIWNYSTAWTSILHITLNCEKKYHQNIGITLCMQKNWGPPTSVGKSYNNIWQQKIINFTHSSKICLIYIRKNLTAETHFSPKKEWFGAMNSSSCVSHICPFYI